MTQSLALIEPLVFVVDAKAVGWQRSGQREGQARVFTPKAMREAKAHVSLVARQAMRGRPLYACALRVTMESVFDIAPSWPQAAQSAARAGDLFHIGKPDADNLTKLVLDSLNGVCWHDDAQVAELLVRKRYGVRAGTNVWIRPIGLDAPMSPGLKRLAKLAAQYPHGAPPKPKRRAALTALRATNLLEAKT